VGTFPDADAALCRSCDAAISGCDECNGDGTICLACMASHHQPNNVTCSLTTVCGQFEYEVEAPTVSTDRECAVCTLCRDGTYASTQCGATADAACSSCSADDDGDCGGASNGLRFYGTCTHDHDTRCDSDVAEDWPPAGIAFVEVALQLGNVPAVNASYNNGSLVDSLRARLVAAVPQLAANVADAPPTAVVLSFSLVSADTADLVVRLRVDADHESVRTGSIADTLEALLTSPDAGALFGNASDPSPDPADVRPFLSGAATTVAGVSVTLQLPTFAPTQLAVTSVTSDSVTITYVDTLNPTADVSGYRIYAQHLSVSTARATAALPSSGRSAMLSLGGRFPQGQATIYVSAVMARGDEEDGRGPLASVTFTVPSCRTGCLECSASACLTCDNSTGYFLPAGGAQCRSLFASTAGSSSCISLGGTELCEASMYGFIVGIVIGSLLLILVVYMCCTHKRVVMKEHEEAVADVYIRDAKFVPRWTQRSRQFRYGRGRGG
jgi:hypothetical protein